MRKRPVAGIPWYSKVEYPKVRRMFAGDVDMPSAYERWLHEVERIETVLISRGARVARIPVKRDIFEAWCRINDLFPSRFALNSYISNAMGVTHTHSRYLGNYLENSIVRDLALIMVENSAKDLWLLSDGETPYSLAEASLNS